MSPRAVPGRPRVGVLAVQGAFAAHRQSLDAVGADAFEVRHGHEILALDGLVIPGGESTTLGIVGGESGVLAAIAQVVDDGMPVFGTCAGMIMLADATTGGAQPLVGGLDIVVRRNAYGRQRASFEVDLDAPAFGPEPFPGVFIRAPWIEGAGPEVETLAWHDGRAVAVRQGSLLATSFHPELTDDVRVHRWFVELVRERRDAGAQLSGGRRVRAQ